MLIPPRNILSICPKTSAGSGVNYKSVFVVRVLGVTVGSERADKLSFAPLAVERAPDVVGSPGGIAVIHYPANRNLKPIDSA